MLNRLLHNRFSNKVSLRESFEALNLSCEPNGKYTLAFVYLATTNESLLLSNQRTESLMLRAEDLGE